MKIDKFLHYLSYSTLLMLIVIIAISAWSRETTSNPIPLNDLKVGHSSEEEASPRDFFEPLVLRKCIAREENRQFQKKEERYAANVLLTREFMNEILINYVDLPIKASILKEICQKDKDASLIALQYFMLLKHEVLALELLKSEEQKRMATDSFNEIIEKLPAIFLNYTAALEAHAPIYDCLKNEIPELTRFLDQYKYLESEASPENDLLHPDNIKQLQQIFAKISLYKEIYNRCEVRKQKMMKKHLPKKINPKSNPAA